MSKKTVKHTNVERNAAIFMACVSVLSLLALVGWAFNLPILASGNTTINAFQIQADGTLNFLASYSSPAGATGLAAR
jgi:hypothetical protein